MGKIVLEIDRPSGLPAEYRSLDQDSVMIGRGFDNDVIINDPYVEARHVCIRRTESGWSCEDLGGANGTFLTGQDGKGEKVRVNGTATLCSGDVLGIGRTAIRVWEGQHPVEPARILPVARIPSFFAYPHKTGLNLFFALLAFYAVFYFVFYHLNPRKEIPLMMILAEETLALVCLVAWAGVWATITRSAKRQHRMGQHLLFTCQWVILNYFAGVLLKNIIFFFCDETVAMVLSCITFGLLGGFVLYVHMAIATNMSAVKRAVVSGCIMLSMIVLGVLLFYGWHDVFEPDPRHFVNLVPMPELVIPTIPISEEIKRLDILFQK